MAGVGLLNGVHGKKTDGICHGRMAVGFGHNGDKPSDRARRWADAICVFAGCAGVLKEAGALEKTSPTGALISDRDALTAIGAPPYIGGGVAMHGANDVGWFSKPPAKVWVQGGWM